MPDHIEEKSDKSDKIESSQMAGGESCSSVGLLGKSIIHSLPLGIVTFDADLSIVEFNPAAKRLVALSGTIDKSLEDGSDGTGGAGPDWAGELKSVVSGGETRSFNRIAYTLNGETRLLGIVCVQLKEIGTEKILGGAMIIEDATEKAGFEKKLADIEKLATVGKLASKVAHELNNPMDGILRYINLTLRILEQENLEKPKEYLGQCRQGLMRMVQIVSELLEFSRGTQAPFEFSGVEQIIEDAMKPMEPRAEASSVRILRDYAPDIPAIRSGNLFQVFCNLIKNAVEAMPGGGELNVTTCLRGDGTVVVEFRDTGVGFAPEHAEAIFEPFFTTKEKGKGTGLGLAVCKDIVERHGGLITAENAPAGGSIFTVYLPVTNENS
ncbi:MAG: two-component system sensor histidine kinase NtrB [Planctomycetota bacterium]|jgi:signal transduction histidine kinase